MRILKSPKVLSVKKLHADGVGCDWFTLREGKVVGDDLIELVEKKGGVLQEIKGEELEGEDIKKPKKGKGRPKKEKVSKPVLQEAAEIVKGVVDDLADDGVLNASV